MDDKWTKEGQWEIASLCLVDPFDEAHSQPEWITHQYPQYTGHQAHHSKLKKTKTFEHKGMLVEIVEEISVKVNGQVVMLHANFDADGQLQCHNTPYTRALSVESLIKVLINNTPKEAIPTQSEHSHHHAEAFSSTSHSIDNKDTFSAGGHREHEEHSQMKAVQLEKMASQKHKPHHGHE
ncbi:hypothetical protein [uncultured Shewanella sp.]|uniref:hypothetical protein n=1 Tax=uncultured Shewanella sp. TaxID=173975 RepID=UPI0026316FCD|nr:hypothetical protein [uncultured Shewanella sp.]